MRADEMIQPVSLAEHRLSHAVLDSLGAGIAVLDRSGRIVFTNQAWLNVFREDGLAGRMPAGVGTNYLEIARLATGPYSAEATFAHQGIQAVLEGSRPEFQMKFQRPADPQARWFLLQVTPMADATAGAVVVSHQDITSQKKAEDLRDIPERKQVEKALSDSQIRLELAIRASNVGPWDWNLVTGEVLYSPEWKSQIGHTGETLSDQLSEWEGRLHPEDHDRIMAEVREYLARPVNGLDIEFRLRHKDGSYRWINSRGQLFRDAAGRPSRLLGCHLDITDRKSLEDQFRQAQKMESIGRLAGGVAHDFNNLLTIILGYSDILLSDPVVDAATQDSLSEIKRAGERASALTRQLLAFSRKQVLEPALLDFNDVVSDCEKMLQRLLGEDVELATYLAPDLGQVRADAGQLEQVLLNLAINARDAMPQGGKLSIETASAVLDAAFAHQHPGVKPGRYVMLTVKDTGCGMDDATKARIFEPFFTTKEQGKGTGLGLAMVFGFIKQSGGHVSVTSEPGKGSSFMIYLPEVEIIPAPDDDETSFRRVPSGAETILLVEDEDGVRTLARRILQNRGYTVLAAAEGIEALAMVRAHPEPIHLLISDVVMPGIGGRQLAEEVAVLRPGIKTLFISGYTDDTVMRHGIQTSETAFLHKPFTVEALPAKVRKVLDQ